MTLGLSLGKFESYSQTVHTIECDITRVYSVHVHLYSTCPVHVPQYYMSMCTLHNPRSIHYKVYGQCTILTISAIIELTYKIIKKGTCIINSGIILNDMVVLCSECSPMYNNQL